MPLAMPVVWSDSCRLHDPGGEVWLGVRTPGTEVPARVDAIRDALVAAGAKLVPAFPHGDEALLAVHDRALVDYLSSIWDEWVAAGMPEEDPGQDRVVPYVFPQGALIGERPPIFPDAVWAKPGVFAYDTMTLIGPGTWEAARAAVDVTLTAVELVLDGAGCAFACTRPPGHHAGRSSYGGSCYLNNAAVAAGALASRLGGPVAVLDVDAHHGNGTQQVFYDRDDVLTCSVHVDPGSGWFPHFVGFEDERGAGDGDGANRNVPLAPGIGDEPWLEGVRGLATWARRSGAAALVIPLGVDSAEEDPEGPLR
ncbi:MAG: hypothetical protein WBB74_06940, partial [Gaiellaceae bacterium]